MVQLIGYYIIFDNAAYPTLNNDLGRVPRYLTKDNTSLVMQTYFVNVGPIKANTYKNMQINYPKAFSNPKNVWGIASVIYSGGYWANVVTSIGNFTAESCYLNYGNNGNIDIEGNVYIAWTVFAEI